MNADDDLYDGMTDEPDTELHVCEELTDDELALVTAFRRLTVEQRDAVLVKVQDISEGT